VFDYPGGAFLLLVFTGLIGMISAFNFRSTTNEAARARAVSEAAAVQLEHANARLEQRVAERTQELAATLECERTQGQALQERLERQRTLNEMINALSMRILPVRPDKPNRSGWHGSMKQEAHELSRGLSRWASVAVGSYIYWRTVTLV
jgi:Flp pilus assembly protein TadB